ncbi:pitrilysin family protein [Hymenobacter ginsengisoli]|uniref:Pitrilysin family protein n=1 Tax=Hymenobacter ginsengisoli TaxID=1051626 RepID=A0ABP8QAZ2_9BACT|nr:pitrilysin family protein [Hymenobacter sp. KCTC 23674]MBO2031584.1 insulinase family protein [Hymenobacter sp. BT559]
MLNRLQPPPTFPLTQLVLPMPTVQHLPNGARLHLLAHDAQPVLRLQVVLPAGKRQEPQPGLAQLAARMLTEGTATRSAREIADMVAFYGASLDCEAGPDRATLTLYCLARHLPTLLPLVQEVLAAPSFPEEELRQTQQRIGQNMRVERQKTSYRASEELNRQLFGEDSAYGRPFDENSFSQLTAAELRAFHAAAYAPAGAEIFLSGDVAAVADAVASGLGQWQPAASPLAEAGGLVAAQAPAAAASLVTVRVEGSIQASLRVGRRWPALTEAQTPELLLLVKVLGGYFGSRLMRNIREDKGFTYGIHASVVAREQAASLVIGTDVNGEQADATRQEIAYELTRLQNEPLGDDELETVKNYTLGKLLGETATVFEQADRYRYVVLQGLRPDYYAELVRRTQAATAEELQALARTYLSPADMLTVVAGGTVPEPA